MDCVGNPPKQNGPKQRRPAELYMHERESADPGRSSNEQRTASSGSLQHSEMRQPVQRINNSEFQGNQVSGTIQILEKFICI